MGSEVAIYLMIASLILSIALMPKMQKPKPAAFEDIEFPQVDEGTPEMVVFGDVWVNDWIVLTVGNYRVTPIEVDGAKK